MTATAAVNVRPAAPSGRWLIWTAGLIVALGAAVATAHGLYRVAIAATVPAPIAWLYPLITDGLALVAYAATTRLAGPGRRYAWAVVVLAAGLSGLAQASYLAIGVHTAPTQLRFGVGAWPAIAAAITAHLLYLLAVVRPAVVRPDVVRPDVERAAVRPEPDPSYGAGRPVQPHAVRSGVVQPVAAGPDAAVRGDAAVEGSAFVQLSGAVPTAPAGSADVGRQGLDGQLSRLAEPVSSDRPADGRPGTSSRGVVHPDQSVRPDVVHPGPLRPDGVRAVRPNGDHPDPVRPVRPQSGSADAAEPSVRPVVRPGVQPAVRDERRPDASTSDAPGDRARAAAVAHRARHGALPTVSALMELADVGRGTAGLALKQVRGPPPAERPGLQLVHDEQRGTSR